ncbi:uncharacterized protein LOC131316059 [Rhododendron vialii]|uniref:uncharacterized protein LOC131316059 n=1 Tax=Rhododendron vialii TaxID=182163 RepID=UPI0026601E09|nr:uncharacterized protein LOC131316059 [Rhododendron vialii]
MSSILNSQGVVLATAMAVSGTVILLALRLQKSFPAAQFQSSSPQLPRSCISSDGKKREKKKKRVQFAEDVVDPVGNSDKFRRQHNNNNNTTTTTTNSEGLYSNSSSKEEREKKREVRGMPANRVALYNGILRDRLVHHRLAYSY